MAMPTRKTVRIQLPEPGKQSRELVKVVGVIPARWGSTRFPGKSLTPEDREVLRHPVMLARNLSMHRWSEQTIAALVMQTTENSMTCYTKPGLCGRRLTSKQGHGEPNPTWIPIGHDAVRRIAKRIGGFPAGGWNDVFNIPMTAHLLGGSCSRPCLDVLSGHLVSQPDRFVVGSLVNVYKSQPHPPSPNLAELCDQRGRVFSHSMMRLPVASS